MRKDVDGSLRVETFGDRENGFVRVSNTVIHKTLDLKPLNVDSLRYLQSKWPLHSELNAELLKIEEDL